MSLLNMILAGISAKFEQSKCYRETVSICLIQIFQMYPVGLW